MSAIKSLMPLLSLRSRETHAGKMKICRTSDAERR
jgi:hypothetical protein